MSVRLESLEAIEAAIWRELASAPQDLQHPWRTPVLASQGDLGVDARTVVLRDTHVARRELSFFSDARAPKVTQLAAHPTAMIVMWSQALGWQLRLKVQIEVLRDGLRVSSHWARLKLSPAAQDYLSALAPGSPLDNALGARGEREHFALLVAHVQAFDWLELHPAGHRRAAFEGTQAHWLQA